MVILAGRGNNGGDGLVVARYLVNDGFPVSVFLLAARDQVRGDALANLKILEGLGVRVEEVQEEGRLNAVVHRMSRAELMVDALLGTGLNSPVRGLLGQVIAKVNQVRPEVLAVDIPSGLSADTGEPLGTAVRARVTVTFGFPKLGQIVPPGRDLAGRLWLVDIGIPPQFAQDLATEIADAAEMRALLPARAFGSHKGTFGHLVVVAGSAGKTGAATLSSEAGLKAGAGLVTAAVPASLNDILEVKLTEAMTLPLPEADGARALGFRPSPRLMNFWPVKVRWPWGRASAPIPRPRRRCGNWSGTALCPWWWTPTASTPWQATWRFCGRPPDPGSSPPTRAKWPASWARPRRRCSPGAWTRPGRWLRPTRCGWCSKAPRPWWPTPRAG